MRKFVSFFSSGLIISIFIGVPVGVVYYALNVQELPELEAMIVWLFALLPAGLIGSYIAFRISSKIIDWELNGS